MTGERTGGLLGFYWALAALLLGAPSADAEVAAEASGAAAAVEANATAPAAAPAAAGGADELAKKLANPIAALISVPLELTWDTNAGYQEQGDITTFIVKPVIPISLNERWNVISRTIIPYVSFNDVIPNAVLPQASRSGLGDVLQNFFFSPKAPTAGGMTWGVGPVISIPTGDDLFTADQWGVGPTAVALVQKGPWTYGGLANQIWGLGDAGRGRDDLDALFIQPFVTRNFAGGKSLGMNLEMNYDWNTSDWKIPLNLSAGKVSRIGTQMVSYSGVLRYYLARPDGAPEWGLRASFTLLFPK